MAFNRPQGDNSDVNIGINVTTNKQALADSTRDLKAFQNNYMRAFAPDNAAMQAATAQIKAHRAEINASREAAKLAKADFSAWREAIADIDRANAIQALTAELVAATKNGKDLTETLARVKAGLQEIGATKGEVAGVLGAARAQADRAGGRGLQTLGREAKLAVPALPIPGTGLSTESAFRLVEVAGRVQQAFGALSPAMQSTIKGASALAIGLAAVAVGFNAINEQFAKQTRAVINSQEEATRLRLQGSKEEIQAAIDKKNADDEITRARIEENKRLLAAVEQGVGPVGAALADVFNVAGVQELRKATQELEQGLTDNAIATGRLESILLDEEVQARLTAEAIDALRKQRAAEIDELARTEVQIRANLSVIAGGTAEAARSRLNSITAENQALSALIKEGDISSEAVTEFATRINELGQELLIVQELLPELENIERVQQAQKDQEEAQKQLIDLTQRAIDLETQGKERLANIAEQGAKQVLAGEERLADARLKLVNFNVEAAAKAAEIDRKFMADDLKRLDDYIVREQRIKRDQRTELLRLAKDEKEALLDAEQENDVAAFIQARRNFARQRTELTEDNATEAGDRAEDLQRERDAIAVNRDERLAALQVETDKKRADFQAEILERENALIEIKDQIAQRVQAEKDAIKQSFLELVNTLDTSVEHMTQTITQGMAAFAAAGINSSNALIDNFVRRANLGIQSIQNQRSTALPPQIPMSNRYNSGVAFAAGGVATKPTFAMIGDRPGFHEAVIPYRPAEGIESAIAKLGLGGKSGPTFNGANMFNGATIGGDVTQADLRAIEQAVYMGFNALTSGQAPGAG